MPLSRLSQVGKELSGLLRAGEELKEGRNEHGRAPVLLLLLLRCHRLPRGRQQHGVLKERHRAGGAVAAAVSLFLFFVAAGDVDPDPSLQPLIADGVVLEDNIAEGIALDVEEGDAGQRGGDAVQRSGGDGRLGLGGRLDQIYGWNSERNG